MVKNSLTGVKDDIGESEGRIARFLGINLIRKWTMTTNHFHLLDIVTIVESPNLLGLGSAEVEGFICQVRRYPDDTFRYVLGSSTEEAGGIYDENNLSPTGRRTTVEAVATGGRYNNRDIVTVCETCDQLEIAGHSGVILGAEAAADGELLYSVWVEDTSAVWLLDDDELIPTGERQTPRGPWTATSTKVDAQGDIVNIDEYTVLEDAWDL